jgi:response regulator RpfG family c-di-GMP phosphodiesterase
MVDKTSRNHHIVGIGDYISDPVSTAVNEFKAPCNHQITAEHINIRNIKTDTRTQFISSNFLKHAPIPKLIFLVHHPSTKSKITQQNGSGTHFKPLMMIC